MESLYFLIPCALIFIVIAVKVLFWAINAGQYDNLDTEAHRILFDDEKVKPVATVEAEPSAVEIKPSAVEIKPLAVEAKPSTTKPSAAECEKNQHE